MTTDGFRSKQQPWHLQVAKTHKFRVKNWLSATEILFAAFMIHLGSPPDGEKF